MVRVRLPVDARSFFLRIFESLSFFFSKGAKVEFFFTGRGFGFFFKVGFIGNGEGRGKICPEI